MKGLDAVHNARRHGLYVPVLFSIGKGCRAARPPAGREILRASRIKLRRQQPVRSLDRGGRDSRAHGTRHEIGEPQIGDPSHALILRSGKGPRRPRRRPPDRPEIPGAFDGRPRTRASRHKDGITRSRTAAYDRGPCRRRSSGPHRPQAPKTTTPGTNPALASRNASGRSSFRSDGAPGMDAASGTIPLRRRVGIRRLRQPRPGQPRPRPASRSWSSSRAGTPR